MTTATTARTIANDSLFCEARVLMKKLEDDLVAPDAMHATHDQIERMVVTEGHKILRAMLQQHYDLRAALEREVAVKAIDRQKRDRLRQSIRRLETLVGEVEVQRTLYQGEDVPYLAPLEGVLALPRDKYSHEVRRIAAEESARSSFDEATEAIDKRTGAHVPKRQVEALSVRAAQLVVLTFDDKGIAMRHADLREATRKAAETTPRPLHSRLTKGEKPNRKRMAHVAAVYSLDKRPRTIADVLHGLHDPKQLDAKRPRPVNKRVWASIEHPGQDVIILTEVGPSVASFPSENHFVSWLRLCPRTPVSGGKPIKKRRNSMGANRISGVLRMAALSAQRSRTALGAAFRRIARHKGGAVAVFATARQLAVHVYRMLRHGHDYVDIGEKAYDDKFQARRLAALKENAKSMGFSLVQEDPIVAT